MFALDFITLLFYRIEKYFHEESCLISMFMNFKIINYIKSYYPNLFIDASDTIKKSFKNIKTIYNGRLCNFESDTINDDAIETEMSEQNEILLYFTLSEIEEHNDRNILQFYKESNLERMKLLCRFYFGVLLSESVVERMFSYAGCINTKLRNRMSPNTLNSLLLSKLNLLGENPSLKRKFIKK